MTSRPGGVFFDCRYIRPEAPDGIGRFSLGLVWAYRPREDLTLLVSDPIQLELLPPECPWILVTGPTSLRERFLAKKLNAYRPRVVFSPMQTMGSWGRRFRLVLTVHDLIYYRHRTPPDFISGWVRILWRAYHLSFWPQRRLLSRADRVVTPSDTTRKLVYDHRLFGGRVEVVPNASALSLAVSQSGYSPEPARLRSASRSLVYIGSFAPYKNVETLVRALDRLPEYCLYLVSRPHPKVRRRLSDLAARPDQLRWCSGLGDEEIARLLGRSQALVHASKDEGFGIPLLDAAALATPLVVSDIPVFREIAAEAAQFFDPDDPQALARAIRRLEDPESWRNSSMAAAEISLRYSWARSAERLRRVLEFGHDRALGESEPDS